MNEDLFISNAIEMQKKEEINASQSVLDQHILKQNVPLYLKIREPWIFNREKRMIFPACKVSPKEA